MRSPSFTCRSPVALVTLLAPFVLLAASAGAVPLTLGYGGRLVDTGGTPVPGTVDLSFGLFTTPTGGSALFEETQTSVALNDGYFYVLINSVASATDFDALFIAHDVLYLQTTVGSTVLTPRQVLGGMPWSVSDTLASLTRDTLSCTAGTVATFDGLRWTCAAALNNTPVGTLSPGAWCTAETGGLGTQIECTRNLATEVAPLMAPTQEVLIDRMLTGADILANAATWVDAPGRTLTLSTMGRLDYRAVTPSSATALEHLLQLPLTTAGQLTTSATYRIEVEVRSDALTDYGLDNDLIVGVSDGTNRVYCIRGDAATGNVALVCWSAFGPYPPDAPSRELLGFTDLATSAYKRTSVTFILDSQTQALASVPTDTALAVKTQTIPLDRTKALTLFVATDQLHETHGIYWVRVRMVRQK